MLVVLVGCAADAPEPTPSDETPPMDVERPATMDGKEDSGLDVCGLAAALPEDDICRHVCDPDALAAQLEADGADTGACYQLYCQLTTTSHVLVGVCLAP